MKPPTPSAADIQTKAGMVYASLRGLLLTNQFRPNEPLYPPALARKFNVSQTPVREALQRLGAEGLLTATPNRGVATKAFNVEEQRELFQTALLLLKTAIESNPKQAAKLILPPRPAATNGTAAACPAIDVETAARALEARFSRIADLSGNREISRIIASINARTHVVRAINFQDKSMNRHMTRSIDEMEGAIAAGNVDRALAVFIQQAERNLSRLPVLVREANQSALVAQFP